MDLWYSYIMMKVYVKKEFDAGRKEEYWYITVDPGKKAIKLAQEGKPSIFPRFFKCTSCSDALNIIHNLATKNKARVYFDAKWNG